MIGRDDWVEPSVQEKMDTFAANWPILVNIRAEWPKAHAWLLDRADHLGVPSNTIFTSIRFQEYGFKDPKLAMEFKLTFG